MSRLMMERRLGQALGGSGAITVLSGLLLFWRDFGSPGDPSASMIAFGVGGLAGLSAWILGATLLAPMGRRLAPPVERLHKVEEVEEEIRSVVGSAARFSPILGTLVFAAVVLMAVSRYL
ncbi:MAG: hypothetical protein ACRDWS_16365 [Acidimicrobiia bacterium]